MQPYFEQGGITIYHGDAREVLPLLGVVDLVLTDPPYGVGMRAFDDDFSTVRYLDNGPGTLLGMFMSPRRIADTIHALPSWSFERLLWMHKTADIAMPWRGWCMNSEAIMLFSRRGATWPKPQDFRTDVYSVGPWERPQHPNGKPVSVVRDLVRRLSALDGVILDPFMGSGTTLRAAKDLGRRCIGVEIEERYCEIAALRLSQEVMDFGVVLAATGPETP